MKDKMVICLEIAIIFSISARITFVTNRKYMVLIMLRGLKYIELSN
jgi:hypothetical protein